MNFFHAKKELRCNACKGIIARGEEVVRITLKTNIGLIFHPDCFRQWNERIFVKRLLEWRKSSMPRPKIGRPQVPTLNRKKRRQLLSLKSYHLHAGHKDKVEKINEEIRRLEIRDSD